MAWGVPREVGRETRLALLWQRSMEDQASSGIDGVLGAEDVIPVHTEERYALLDGESGVLLKRGLTADVFTASSGGFINQVKDTPRWAVQTWDGGVMGIIRRQGVPRLHGRLVVQFGPHNELSITDAATQEEWGMRGSEDGTAYDVLDRRGPTSGNVRPSGAGVWIAVGSLRGNVVIAEATEERRWVHEFAFQRHMGRSPVVYGVRFAPAPEGFAARVLVVQGKRPQRLMAVDVSDAGDVVETTLLTIPAAREVHWPVGIVVDATGRVAVGVDGAVIMVDPRQPQQPPLIVPLNGVTGTTGVVAGAHGYDVVAGPARQGAYLLVGKDQWNEPVPVMLPWADVSAVRQRRDGGVVVLRREHTVAAVEVRG